MRAAFHVLSFLAVIAAGFWAYRENYATQTAMREVRTLQREITALRDSLAMMRAEWAYLNRPERLRELVVLNFDALQLLPMEPAQFANPADLAYPPPTIPAIPAPDGQAFDGIDDGATALLPHDGESS